MTNYSFTRNIPAANNDPSVDQPKMLQNNNSTDSLIAEDHYGFGVDNGGFHKQTRMPNLLSIPTGRINGSGTSYVKNENLFYTNGTTGNEYQMTNVRNANFSTFGQFSPSGIDTYGWTFLPGNLILMYGTTTYTANGLLTIGFPFTLNTIFSVNATLQAPAPGVPSVDFLITSTSTNGFTVRFIIASFLAGKINWMAIGN